MREFLVVVKGRCHDALRRDADGGLGMRPAAERRGNGAIAIPMGDDRRAMPNRSLRRDADG